MANEILDTTNKLMKPGEIPSSDNAVIQQLSENLQGITIEEVDVMCDEMEEAEKRREYEKKKLMILQKLNDFREWRKNEIDLDDSTKNKIINIVENTPMNIDIDADWSLLIEITLELAGHDTVLKILNPNLENHTDDEYRVDKKYVKLWWMLWDETNRRANRNLFYYVLGKQREWLKIPQQEDIEKILNELWEYANLNDREDQIAMFMYITWMNWEYRLGTWTCEKSKWWRTNGRYCLWCEKKRKRGFGGCKLYITDDEEKYANLCMISRNVILRL